MKFDIPCEQLEYMPITMNYGFEYDGKRVVLSSADVHKIMRCIEAEGFESLTLKGEMLIERIKNFIDKGNQERKKNAMLVSQ